MPAKMNFVSKFAERALGAAGRMKRVLLPAVVVILGLSLLTACSAGASNSTASSASAVGLPAETVLAAGTLKLEGTAQAVDAKEAADLLPLWQLLKQLKSSSATAQAEVDAVVEKIAATMTAEQSSAIDEMGLSQADVVTVESSSGSSSASGATSTRSNSQSAAGGPGFGAGGPPPDAAGGMPLEATLGGAASSSTVSQSSSAAGATSSTVLIQQVIKLLQTKMGG